MQYVQVVANAFMFAGLLSFIIWLHIDALKSIAATGPMNESRIYTEYRDRALASLKAGNRRDAETQYLAINLFGDRPRVGHVAYYCGFVLSALIPLFAVLLISLRIQMAIAPS